MAAQWRVRPKSLDETARELREAVGSDEWFAIPLATRFRLVRHVFGVDAEEVDNQ